MKKKRRSARRAELEIAAWSVRRLKYKSTARYKKGKSRCKYS